MIFKSPKLSFSTKLEPHFSKCLCGWGWDMFSKQYKVTENICLFACLFVCDGKRKPKYLTKNKVNGKKLMNSCK